MQNNVQEDRLLNIDITDYWLILNKRFFQIVLVFILVLAATLFYTFNQIPIYQAEARIRIAARQPMATIEGAQITWYGAGPANSINSEIELIISKDQILKTALEFLIKGGKAEALEKDKEYYTEDEVGYIRSISSYFTNEERKYVSKLTPDALRSVLKIEPVKSSDIVSIKIKDRYENFAIAAANLIAIAYRADFWKCKTLDAFETKNFIEGQLKQVKGEIDQDRVNLEKSTEETVSLGSAEKYKDELTSLRIELEKLKESYQDSHPRIIKQKKLIETIEKELNKFPKTKQTYDDNLAEWELKQQLRKTLGEYLIKSEIDYEAKKLKSKDEVQVVSYAKGANTLKANDTLNILAGTIFGLILGCLYAFIWEGLDTSIGKIEDVERITGLPVIAHVPLIGGKTGKKIPFTSPFKLIIKFIVSLLPFRSKDEPMDLDKKILFNFDILSMTAEAYRTLRTNIQFAIGTHKTTGIAIAITSTSPREGKTLTSTNLAISLAQMGKTTLLVEGDMRRPRIAELFKINEKPGLSDILIGTAKVDEAIRTFTDVLIGNSKWENLLETPGVDNLNIIPCGTLPPNPTELLLSNEFREIFAKFKEKYDFIIIDTPPTIPVSDSSIVSSIVDGTVIIYQSDTTSRHLLLRALHTLRKNQAKLLGIVINQLSFDVILRTSKSRYQYGYGYGYGYRTEKTRNKH